MKRTVLFLIALVPITLLSQPFTFSHFDLDYEELIDPINLNVGIWDDPQYIIELGFPFSAMGTMVDEIYISGAFQGGALSRNSFFDGGIQDIMMVYGSDIIDAGYAQDSTLSQLSYKTSGPAGDQICKLEYRNCAFYGEYAEFGTSYNRVSFQVWFYEIDHAIEVHYGPHSIKQPDLAHAPFNGAICVFLNDVNFDENNFGDAWYVGGTLAEPTFNLLPGGQDPDVDEFLNSDPYSGKVFRFVPTSVSVNENFDSTENLSLYPNPAQDVLNLYYTGSPQMKIDYSIIDLTGKIIMRSSAIEVRHEIDISNLDSGIYMIRIEVDNKFETRRFTKV